ncbi:MAG: porin [Bacteroidota bacterium]
MNTHRLKLAVVLYSLTGILFAQNPSKVTFGKGMSLMAEDSSVSMKFQFRMQHLFDLSQGLGDGDELKANFLVRRARLKFSGHVYNPKLTYKAELGLTSKDISTSKEDGNTGGSSRIILDAVLKYQFAKNWSFWVGQTKLPGNRERVISSSALQFVDRSILNSKFNIDRDMGVQLHGKYKLGNAVLRPKFAFTAGEGRDISSGNIGGFNYTGRVEYLPFGDFEGKSDDYVSSDLKRQPLPKLALGATYNFNDDAVRQQGQLGSFVYQLDGLGQSTGDYAQHDLYALQLDAFFKYKGLSWMTEYAVASTSPILGNGEFIHVNGSEVVNDEAIINGSKKFNTGTAVNTQVGYLFPNNFEVAGRYTTISPDTQYSGLKETTEYTLGVSKYIVGHNLKIQSDFTYQEYLNADDAIRFRLQFEVQF